LCTGQPDQPPSVDTIFLPWSIPHVATQIFPPVFLDFSGHCLLSVGSFAVGQCSVGRRTANAGSARRGVPDWQWDNPGWVTTDAVLTGAWTLPNEHRSVLLFANVGDEPITAKLSLNAALYGLAGDEVKVATITATGPGESFLSPLRIQREVRFAPRSAFAWELTPAEAKP
jgi:hypothetical protein